jgi:serine/threonine-protein kinase
LLGTPAFMAPEQALGRWKEVDERADIWAIGATLFTLLSGRFVHEADAVQEQLVLAATHRAPPVQRLAPDTPAWLAAIVDRALSFAREERFPDARSMQAALRASASGIEFPAYPVGASGASTPRLAAPSSPLLVTPALAPRQQSSPSFGEGATLAAPSTDLPAVSSVAGGTYASVQAVARSAQEPAPVQRSRGTFIAVIAVAALGLAGFGTFWKLRSPMGGSVSLPTAAAAPASVSPPASAAPSAMPRAIEPAAPQASAPSPAASAPHPLLNIAKKPQNPSKPPSKPDKPENLFDIRH